MPFFERAVALDPQFAEAWACLAATHAFMAFLWEGPVEKEVGKAVEAAHKAIQLDESNAGEAWLALAILGYAHDRDWPACERAYRRALELSPNSSLAHLNFALALASRDRTGEALEHVALARQADPLSFCSTSNNEATILYCARRYEEAIRVARRHLEMNPQFMSDRYVIGKCLTAEGKLPEAVAELQRVATEGVRSFPVLGRLGYALARAGRLAEARSVLAEIESMQRSEPRGADGVARAQILLAMGENGRAIASLREGAAAYVPDVNFMGVDSVYDPIRREPGFQELCARLGLPNRTPDGATHR